MVGTSSGIRIVAWPRFQAVAGSLGWWLTLILGGGLAAVAQGNSPESDEKRFQATIEAGEFSTAYDMATSAPPARRDLWLEALARSQAAAGTRLAAYATLAEIGDDRARTRALGEIADTPAARGGGVEPDFESLMALIQATIAPTTWSEVGGAGAMEKFPGGVLVDAEGMLRRRGDTDSSGRLSRLRQQAAVEVSDASPRRPSPLRKVSLPRLEREIQLRLAARQPLDEEMRVLAGLQRVEYVMVYPDTGDLVIAGPAGDWAEDEEGRIVAVDGRRPVVRLDDLVTLLRRANERRDEPFGCSIEPTERGLTSIREFVARSSQRPLKPGERSKWLADLAAALGPQTINVFGIDPRCRVAHVLVEADYRMKLVGIGLEEGLLEVPSYLELLTVRPGEPLPALDVLRWWFTLDYEPVECSTDRDVFRLRGRGVKVLSENEMLNERGQRVHTGQSDALNQDFAHRFTRHFETLAAKYPIYAELQNAFDLAVVTALMRSEGLPERVGWHAGYWLDPRAFAVAQAPAPRTVDTVINHRVVNRTVVLAAVSGGVSVDVRPVIGRESIRIDGQQRLASDRDRSAPGEVPRRGWWWD